MNKNKIFLLLIIIAIFSLVGVYFLNNSSQNTNNEKNTNNQDLEPKIINNEISEDLTKIREEISLNDVVKLYSNWNLTIDNILIKNTKNIIDQINSKQKYKITQNYNWWITLDEAREIFSSINPKIIREINLQLDIYDDKNNLVSTEWNIYVNNINVWKIVDWKFNWVFPWVIWTEYFNILVRTKEYNDGFLTLNALNTNGSLLYSEVVLKKSEYKEIDLSVDNNINFNNYTFTLPKCSFAKDWKCLESKVTLKSTYFTQDDVNNNIYSLNMRAIDDKWEVVELVSWWMAFNEFYSWDEILEISPNAMVEINYKIWKSEIENMEQNQVLNWYWHYSKDLGIWKFLPSQWTLDANKQIYKIKTNTIY